MLTFFHRTIARNINNTLVNCRPKIDQLNAVTIGTFIESIWYFKTKTIIPISLCLSFFGRFAVQAGNITCIFRLSISDSRLSFKLHSRCTKTNLFDFNRADDVFQCWIFAQSILYWINRMLSCSIVNSIFQWYWLMRSHSIWVRSSCNYWTKYSVFWGQYENCM